MVFKNPKIFLFIENLRGYQVVLFFIIPYHKIIVLFFEIMTFFYYKWLEKNVTPDPSLQVWRISLGINVKKGINSKMDILQNYSSKPFYCLSTPGRKTFKSQVWLSIKKTSGFVIRKSSRVYVVKWYRTSWLIFCPKSTWFLPVHECD